jgi:hypothetical protein
MGLDRGCGTLEKGALLRSLRSAVRSKPLRCQRAYLRGGDHGMCAGDGGTDCDGTGDGH